MSTSARDVLRGLLRRDHRALVRARSLPSSGARPRGELPLFIEALEPSVAPLIAHVVEEGEVVMLAWRMRAESPIARFAFVTDARALVVSVPEEGAVTTSALDRAALALLPPEIARRAQLLIDAPRAVRIARALFAHFWHHGLEPRRAARNTTHALCTHDDPTGTLAAAFLDDGRIPVPADVLSRALRAFAKEDPSGTLLADVADGLGLGFDAFTFLVDTARADGLDARWSLPLHTRALGHLSQHGDSSERVHALLDVALHALDAGDQRVAMEHVDFALAELPERVDDEILDTALTSVGRLRARAFALAARALGGHDVGRARDIVRASPFDPDAWETLARALDPWSDRAARARAAGAVARGAIAPAPESDDLVDTRVHALSADDRRAILGERGKRDPVFFVQSLLAEIEAPDPRALLDYCERATDARAPFLVRAAREAATLLGLPTPTLFVSRGTRATGVRAFADKAPNVIVGVAHLASGEAPLDARAARFVVATELAHLAFGHTRFTIEDVWNGLMKKGRASIGMVLTVLPSGGAIGTVKKALTLASQASTFAKAPPPSSSSGDLTPPASAFIDAHRAMQRRADRVGLALCDDVHAAVRALAAVDARVDAEIARAREEGLARVLLRRDAEGEAVNGELAIRIADLLFAFVDDAHGALVARVRTRVAQKVDAKGAPDLEGDGA